MKKNNNVKKIGILFSRLSGYMAACLKELKLRHDIELIVYRRPPASNAPFDDRHFDWIDSLIDATGVSSQDILKEVRSFNPDALFIVGWADKRYLEVARTLRKSGVPVIAGSDAQWEGTLKQQMGTMIAPWYLHNAIDVLWVAGERQRQFARKLGFPGNRCWTGYYSCNWPLFAHARNNREDLQIEAFLYVGRYVEVKGLDVLVEAYKRYRERVRDPWPLFCIGSGKLESMLNVSGINNIGFVQPDALPEQMAKVSAFVLAQPARALGCCGSGSCSNRASAHLLGCLWSGCTLAAGWL